MAIITTIAGVPLFSTVQEALTWAARNGLRGYHVHRHQGQLGYMGGFNHQQATGMPLNTNAPTQTNVPNQRTTSTRQSIPTVNIRTGSGGY
tara:strand:- start:215 stop:487 length:273 start_codon:yes stop_codon:yes gene_type:complete